MLELFVMHWTILRVITIAVYVSTLAHVSVRYCVNTGTCMVNSYAYAEAKRLHLGRQLYTCC